MKWTVDNFELQRWRGLTAESLLPLLSAHAKADPSFRPTTRRTTTRWHCNVDGYEFELLCCGPKFFDTRAACGGGGAIDLVMHLKRVTFRAATRLLRELDV